MENKVQRTSVPGNTGTIQVRCTCKKWCIGLVYFENMVKWTRYLEKLVQWTRKNCTIVPILTTPAKSGTMD